MPDRRSVSPQGASSGSSSPQRSPSPQRRLSPAASLAGSKHHQYSAKNDLPSKGQSPTSVLANRPEPPSLISVSYNRKKESAFTPIGNHILYTPGLLSNLQRSSSRHCIKISRFDPEAKTVDLQNIIKLFFSRFGKLMSFAFHGKFAERYCLLSYAHEQERNKALAVDGQRGPLKSSLRVEPWDYPRDPKGYGIKIANIRFSKGQNISDIIREEFKRFGLLISIQVVRDNEVYVKLFYKFKSDQMKALSSGNHFSAQLGAIQVSPLSDGSQHDKIGMQGQRHRIDQRLISSVNLRRDIGPRYVIPASNPFPVSNPFPFKDVQRQSDNTNLSPFTRSGPNMALPFYGRVEHSRTRSPKLNLPMQQICTNFGSAIEGQPHSMNSQYQREHGNALGSLKPPNLNYKAESVTVPKSHGTVRSGASASHHKASLTLWVNNLEDKTTNADLWTVFQPFGEIQHIEIREGFRNTGKQAFLQYLNLSSIYEAIQQMDGKYLGRSKLQLDFAYPHQPTNCVWLCGLPTVANRRSLENIFRQFGPVVQVLYDSVKNASLVLYNDIASAVKAVNEINSRSVFGCQVSLGFANRRCQLGFCHSMESSGQNVEEFYRLVGETSEWLLRKANIEKLLTPSS